MEIKVQCDCGQKFKFDVEPVGGRMPWEVNCPVCGASGTEKANVLIQQRLQATPAIPVATIINTTEQNADPQPAASQEPAKLKLSINRPAPAAQAPPVEAPPIPRPVPRTMLSVKAARRAAAEREARDANFWLSVAAVFIGAILGMALWHFGYRITGWRLGFMALITGCAAGAAPQILGHYRGVAMGLIAAFVTFVAIFTTQFLNAKVEIKEVKKEWVEEEAQSYLEEAKAALAAVPNGTDQEIRAYLAKEQSFESFRISPANIDAEEVRLLRSRLPAMRELVEGKITAAEYQKREQDAYAKEEYESAVAEAKAVVTAVPNGTEQEMRMYIVNESRAAGYQISPAEVDPEEIAGLQAEYPQLKRLAEGRLTQEQYFIQQGDEELAIDEDDILNFYVIFQTVGIFNIINIVLGIGAAFLTAKG